MRWRRSTTSTASKHSPKILAKHFVDNFSHVSSATVSIDETLWNRIALSGKPHAHAFIGGSNETRTCVVETSREATKITGGINGMTVLKTTRSGFVELHQGSIHHAERNDRSHFRDDRAGDVELQHAGCRFQRCLCIDPRCLRARLRRARQPRGAADAFRDGRRGAARLQTDRRDQSW